MRAKWANINKDHTTEERALFLSISIQFKCALLAWQKLYICIAKAIAAGLLTNSAYMY